MNAERWSLVEQLFHAALERPADERSAFVESSCDDLEVRRQVEALLAADAEPDDRESLAAAVASDWAQSFEPSIIGRDVDGYRIDAELGAGGMGEVYRAHETAL